MEDLHGLKRERLHPVEDSLPGAEQDRRDVARELVDAAGHEVEDRPAFHLDWLVSVMGEHKHWRVVGRLGAPPAAPVLIPLAADRPEHVPPHDVRAARAHEPAGRRRVRVVGARVAEMPDMQLAPTLAEWILAALVGPSDEA